MRNEVEQLPSVDLLGQHLVEEIVLIGFQQAPADDHEIPDPLGAGLGNFVLDRHECSPDSRPLSAS